MALRPISSTSSFKRRLVWIAITAAGLLVAYALAVDRGWVPATDGFQVRDKNRIKCERYLLDPTVRPEVVLVGSSLSANLPVQEVCPRVFNLGLAGDSAWTGLSIVESRRDFRPALVVIEGSDLLMRDADHAFLENLLSPRWLWLHEHLKMLRTEYQPAGVFLKAIGRWQKRRKDNAVAGNGATATPSGPADVPAVTLKLLAEARDNDARDLSVEDRQRLTAACARLRETMDRLTARGVRCVLQRVPGDATLADSLRNRSLFALLEQELPTARYPWLPYDAGLRGRTWDATHLVEEDAAAHARYLCAQLPP